MKEYRALLACQEEDAVELLSENFLSASQYASAQNPVATTWLITFDEIRYQHTLAVDYLLFVACIEGTAVPIVVLPSA